MPSLEGHFKTRPGQTANYDDKSLSKLSLLARFIYTLARCQDQIARFAQVFETSARVHYHLDILETSARVHCHLETYCGTGNGD